MFNAPERWKYYSSFNEQQFALDDILDNGDEAVRFIKEYFQCGGKFTVVDFIAKYCEPSRAIHSISTFFLGILLIPLFRPHHSNTNCHSDNNLHLWLWFLTCLYHDMAYKFENDRASLPSMNEFISNQQVKYDLFKDSEIKLQGANKKAVRSYYRYRLKEHHCVDHGIVGGVLVYDSLRKNYENIYDDCLRQGHCDYDDFTYNKLHYGTWHFQEFEKCANAIIQHNIWFQSKEEKDKYEKYKEYHLEDLTYESSKHPQYQDWLTALLVFCDTIEPLKRFPTCKPSSILQKIKYEFDEQDYELKISLIDSCTNAIQYFDGVLGMKEWTALSIDTKGKNISILGINRLYD